MRVLIAWGSKRGGTEGIARALGDALTEQGFEVTLCPAHAVRILRSHYDAAIIGGALYSRRWQRDARRAITRNVAALRSMPVWFFSSGPLDDTADHAELPPTPLVAALMKRVGAQGHRTFGGRLTPDAKGFPASAMAKQRSGDWRNFDRVRAWALELARALPLAKPAGPVAARASSAWHAGLYGAAAWAICASVRAVLHHTIAAGASFAAYLVVVPLVYIVVARSVRAPDALASALVFTAIYALLDELLTIVQLSEQLAIPAPLESLWPLLLAFVATWVTGVLRSVSPVAVDAGSRH